MPAVDEQKSVVDFIKRRIKMMSLSVILINFVVFLLIVMFVYEFLEYIPIKSVVAMLTVMAMLMLVIFQLSNVSAKKAVESIEEFGRKMDTLLSATKKVHEIGFSDVLVDSVMETARDITRADGCSLLLLEGDSLVFKKVKGGRGEGLVGTSIPKSKGVVGWVVGTGAPLRVDDVKKDGRFFSELDKSGGYDTRSVLCVPLKASSSTIGAIELVNKSNGAFTREDEAMMSYFATQAAASIEKTRFFEDEKNYEIHVTNILLDAIDNISGKRGHSRGVAKYSLIMAEALKMNEESKKRLHHAALLHDIGFLVIDRDSIATGEGYKQHSRLGYEMLKPINFYSKITTFILYHHERYDGKGYPSGLNGEDIPKEARIICIAEAFDSMVNRNSYKTVGTLTSAGVLPTVVQFERAIEELRKNAGTQFDAELVGLFLKNLSADDLAS